MRVLVVLCFLTASYAAYYEDTYAKMVSKLEGKRAKLSWQHGLNPRFRGMSKAQLSSMTGTWLQSRFEAPHRRVGPHAVAALPKSFDSRQRWFGCHSIRFIRDQSNCGSCWARGFQHFQVPAHVDFQAVSAASAMSDRICIATEGRQQPWVSDQFIMSCCQTCGNGCHGGDMCLAFQYWQEGYPSGGPYGSAAGCQPYTIQCPTCKEMSETPKCSFQCIPECEQTLGESMTYGTTTPSVYKLETPEEAMADIMKHGPIVTGYELFEDFYYYRGGVYEYVWGESKGGHAVRVIGWGEEDGIKYWLATNSWNTTFGISGLFKIKRSVNMAGFEGHMCAGLPLVTNLM